MSNILEIHNASFSYDGINDIFSNINIDIDKNDNICILGANGCGKTTLLNCITRNVELKTGEILLKGKNIHSYSVNQLAKIIGIVYQDHTVTFPYTSLEVVKMGRAPYLKVFETPSKSDEDIAYGIMRDLGIEALADKSYSNISGGQRQLVLIARTLCQNPDIILFDEPTSHLDFKNQAIVMKTIRKLASDGMTTIMISHYPSHVYKTSNRVILMGNKKIIADGKPEEVMTEENLHHTYGVKIKINKLVEEQYLIDIDFSDI